MTYRVGIVGSGFGGTVHAPAYALHPDFEPVAIASPNRAQAIAGERKIPHAFPSLDAMLAAVGNEIDIVSISSPPMEHHAAVMTAIAAGKHVLCEKPMARTLAQAEEMLAAAERAGVVGAIAFEHRYHSAPQALRELVVNGHLPNLREIEVTRFGTEVAARAKRPNSSWWYDGKQGGGLANAFMPHIIDLARFITGRDVVSSYGFLRTANPTRQAPDGSSYPSTASDGVFALADLGDGVAARMTVDGTLAVNQMTVAVHSEERTAVASGESFGSMTLFVVDATESDEYELKPNPYAKYAPVNFAVPAFMRLLDDFSERLGKGTGDCPTFADGVAAQRVLNTIGYEG